MSGVAEWDRGPFDLEEKKVCATCKFWRENAPQTTQFEGSRKYNPGFGKCHCPKIAYDNEIADRDQKTDMMIYWDSEGYAAGMRTGKNFGCVHHEVRA